ncbi:MAG: hypothetical protein PHW79_01775 [Candidatus Marinimicrobia bacterium]|nr:hypothetical protein [Candidatus Neomarinimicrobiota bacterium]
MKIVDKGNTMPSDYNPKAKTATFTIFLILATILTMSCKECPTEPDGYSIDISADFVGASRVRLLVSVSDSGNVREFGIKRDGAVIVKCQLSGKDTLITDNSVEPATAYQYEGIVYNNDEISDHSEPIEVTTLDTTSHEIEWTISRFGYIGSYLRDVCIISEDDIWAVGFIETEETMHNDTLDPYNAAHWNGTEWELRRINPITITGQNYSSSISDIYATSTNNIWAVYGIPMYYDGNSWIQYHLFNMGYEMSGILLQCWGPSSNNMYFAGTNGCFVHYSNTSWTIIETNTSRTINDIHGLSSDLVYMVGSDQDTWSSNFIIYEDGKIRNMDFPDTCVQAVYATAWNDVYLVGQGLLYYDGRKINDWQWSDDLPMNLFQSVSGNGPNDIFLAGHFGTIIHYNGKTWKYYNTLNNTNVLLGAVAVKDDVIIAVGDYGQQANIYHGVRN